MNFGRYGTPRRERLFALAECGISALTPTLR
jgi:hypothetical protein